MKCTETVLRILQLFTLTLKKEAHLALAGVAQLVGALSRSRKVAGSIPGQGTYLGCGFHPQSGCV